MPVTITVRLCPQNHKCPAVRACPVNALIQTGMAAPELDEAACTDCAKCTVTCPTGALTMTD
jgi:Fe-S-cluster-containing hydrogenase component 2